MTKEYWQLPRVKKMNRTRMAEVYQTEEGQEYEHFKRRTARSRYMRGKYAAKRRRKAFTLSFEEYEGIITQPCKYCNQSLYDETGVGLDRIDNTKGYEPGNVNPCCKTCNRIRKDSMSAEVFEKQTELNKRRKK